MTTGPLANLSWSEPGEPRSFSQEVASLPELLEALEALYHASPADPPVLVHVTRIGWDSLWIGIGRPLQGAPGVDGAGERAAEDLSCLLFEPGPDLPTAAGEAEAPLPQGGYQWFGEDGWTTVPASHVLPLNLALRAAAEFLLQDGLPRCVEWEAS